MLSCVNRAFPVYHKVILYVLFFFYQSFRFSTSCALNLTFIAHSDLVRNLFRVVFEFAERCCVETDSLTCYTIELLFLLSLLMSLRRIVQAYK